MGNSGWVYYFGEASNWLWSHDLEWMYAFKLLGESGWDYSHVLGFVWLHREHYPWMYFLDLERWARFESRSEEGFTFWDPATETEFVIGRK